MDTGTERGLRRPIERPTIGAHAPAGPLRRVVAVVILAAVAGLGSLACAGDEPAYSPPVTEDPIERLPLTRQGQGIAPPTITPSTALPDLPPEALGLEPETTEPEVTEPPEEIVLPNPLAPIESVADCVTITATVAGLYTEALGGEAGAQSALAQSAQLRTVVPANLHADLDTVVNAIVAVARSGVLDGEDAMTKPEFIAARERLGDWVAAGCVR